MKYLKLATPSLLTEETAASNFFIISMSEFVKHNSSLQEIVPSPINAPSIHMESLDGFLLLGILSSKLFTTFGVNTKSFVVSSDASTYPL